jgi:hypothetical protein
MKVALPEYNWFVNTAGGYPSTNDYTGSVGVNPQSGGLSHPTLSYRVWVKDLGKDTAKICVIVFLCRPWSQDCKAAEREQIAYQEFECSSECLKQAIRWLNETLESQAQLLQK